MAGRGSLAAFLAPSFPSSRTRPGGSDGPRGPSEFHLRGLHGNSQGRPRGAESSGRAAHSGSRFLSAAVPAAAAGMVCSGRRLLRSLRRGEGVELMSTMQLQRHATVQGEEEAGASTDDEIASLQREAAALRASIAELEEEKAAQRRLGNQRWFKVFDAAGRGAIDANAIQQGMKEFNGKELEATKAKQVLEAHDANRNGVIDFDEFDVTSFQATLEKLWAEDEERERARLQEEQLRREKERAEQEIQEYYSTLPGPNTDTGALTRLGSALAYLLPLLDGLRFGLPLAIAFPILQPFFVFMLPPLQLLNAIPLGQVVAFIVMQVLAGNQDNPTLLRFNLRQAICLDIALFFPNILASFVDATIGDQVPDEVIMGLGALVFVPLIASVGYCMVSSLCGEAPRGIPAISEASEMSMGLIPPGRSQSLKEKR